MREIVTHTVPGDPKASQLRVFAVDEPEEAGANHHYLITKEDGTTVVGEVKFQNGPILEAGVNGNTHEAMLAIIGDRLEGYQRGKFACRENALALTKVQEALHWLFTRTIARLRRGVEGKRVV